ncbi:MAG: tRNA (adenine-N1)-methyltransferase [Actinobacteria bacterium]|nr:tRNA (adenine-N1)-methyltransferase [Actinomycetota bacterium]
MPFESGERVLIVDSKSRRYLVVLQAGSQFHFHRGIVNHDDVIGREDGLTLTTSENEKVFVLRPGYADFVLKMPRGAQVVYPKDVAMIVMYGDIFPGASVIEAGVGSGALSIGLLRAIGERGRLVTYELRDDFARNATSNIEAFLGKARNFELRSGSIYEDLGEGEPGETFDRMVLDVPEPWKALPNARRSLRSGGGFISYLPTIIQSHQLVEAMRATGDFPSVKTFETLVRNWHIEGTSVRPDHRMVAHTGFITVGRWVPAGHDQVRTK